jgi:hypothetical protein
MRDIDFPELWSYHCRYDVASIGNNAKIVLAGRYLPAVVNSPNTAESKKMNPVFTAIVRWQAHFKALSFADMHRMASGISGVDLPQAPVAKRAGSLQGSPLHFSLRRRQHLAWQRYICGGSH